MTGINEYAKTATAVLRCDKCGARWESRLYEPQRWGDEVRACAPAFALGWRVYTPHGRGGHRTYCPQHDPSVDMLPVYAERMRP